MDMGTMMSSITEIWSSFAPLGKVGIIIAAVLTAGVLALKVYLWWNKNKLIHEKTERERREAEAKNPVDNAKDEDDMANAEDKIERL